MNTTTASAARLRAAALALALGAGLTFTPAAFGQATAHPPERMTYQGFLVDGNGVALGATGTKNYDVIFRIYSDATGGDLKWSEQQTVTVDKGYFSVLLGEGAQVNSEAHPALSTLFKGADASDRYVAITVKGIGSGGANVDINPRLRLMTSPYSFLAEQATKLVREDNSADLLTSSGNVLAFNGQLDVLGNNSLEFGAGLTKQNDAGRIGYQLFGLQDSLDIVGAGTAGNNRKIKLWAEGGLTINGPASATSFDGAHLGDGSGLSGVAKLGANTFSGTQSITAGDLRVDNARIFQAKNNIGNYETFMWPRWTDNVMYMNYGSGGFNIRNNSSTPTMFLKDNGNVGIGTTDPTSKLHVNGSVAIQGSSVLQLGQGYTREVSAGQIGYGTHSGGASGSLDIVGAGTADFNRKVQIWSEARLQLNGGIDINPYGHGLTMRVVNDVMQMFHFTDKGKYYQMWRYDGGVALWATGGGFGNGGGNFSRQITWDGDGNWDVSSDRKLKKDIVDAEPMLDRALKIQVRRFRWKDAQEDVAPTLGVIAQELQPLFPDMISEQQDPTTKEKNLAVGYSDFGIIAVKALQELKTKQDTEIQDLKAQVADLKAQMKQVLQAAAELQAASDKSKTTAAVTK